MHDNSQKNLGIRLRLETVGKTNTYTSDIFPHHWKVQPFAGWILSTLWKVKDNHHVYEGKDAFLGLTTSFGKSVRYEVLSFACLTVKKRVGNRAGSQVDVLLVSPFVSLTIAKFICLRVHCFVVVLFFSCVRILLSNILSVYSSTWKSNVNLTILRNYSGIGRACASSQYQAVFSPPSRPGYEASL